MELLLLIGTESDVKVAEKEWWRPESGLRQRRKRISDDAIGAVIGKGGFFGGLGFYSNF
jgi:hypothetical protein